MAVAVLVASGLAAGCRGARRDPFLTYFNAEHALSVRYPATWKTETAQQEGGWYRYFLAPPAGPERKPAVSVTMLAAPLGGTLDAYAQSYLAGNTLTTTREETRPGGRGKSWRFASSDGKTRYGLLLLLEGQTVYGLFSQGEAANFESSLPVLEEMDKSLTLERPALYTEEKNEKYAFSLRVPPSWKATRSFYSGGTFLQQFQSPAFAAEKAQTVHASLTLTVEDLPPGATLDSFYQATRQKLGDSIQVLDHDPWNRVGYVDILHSETQVAVSRGKRWYRVSGGRGYTLALEARDDIYLRANRWCDLIAETLKVGPEVAAP